MDYTADGTKALASCEFSGRLALIDLVHEKVLRYLVLKASAMPQDVKLSPDGHQFYVADMASGGVWIVNSITLRHRFERTGKGAHGLYVSRDSRFLYVTNRAEGTISILGANSGRRLRKWHLPGGGSPDMGGVSASGRVLWLSGRYNGVVYAIDTTTGHLIRSIRVGNGPHGLAVWPQPGRYSIGHTGIMR
jgi:DNA-binding beta-propeller fold protein YncE